MSPRRLHFPRGSLRSGAWDLELTTGKAGWSWCSLRVLELAPGGSSELQTEDDEVLVVPLSGACLVSYEDEEIELQGRASPFQAETDFCYAPRGASVVIASRGGGRFAIPGAKAQVSLPFRYGARGDTVEVRGAGSASRRVNNLCLPATFETDRLIVCEIFTPGGNWSSFPPHKHDESREDECELEEIYYYEIDEDLPGNGIGYQRVYGTLERPIELLAEIHTGDTVLVPHGWHGPAMAVPGYDLYYMNVMAGPCERSWLARDDPVHSWVRETWTAEQRDPRLRPWF